MELSIPKIKNFQEGTFWAQKTKKKPFLEKIFIFQEMELSSLKLEKLLYFRRELDKVWKTTKIFCISIKKVLPTFRDDCWWIRKMKNELYFVPALETISVEVVNILYLAWKFMKWGKSSFYSLGKKAYKTFHCYIWYFKLRNYIKHRGLWEVLERIRVLYANSDGHSHICAAFRKLHSEKNMQMIINKITRNFNILRF